MNSNSDVTFLGFFHCRKLQDVIPHVFTLRLRLRLFYSLVATQCDQKNTTICYWIGLTGTKTVNVNIKCKNNFYSAIMSEVSGALETAFYKARSALNFIKCVLPKCV